MTDHHADAASARSLDPGMVVVGLSLALVGARTREQVRDSLWDAWDCVRAALDEGAADSIVRAILREALARALADSAISRSCAWSAFDEARTLVAALDDGVDRDARESVEREAHEEDFTQRFSSWIESTHFDDERLDRTITVAFDELSPPRAHRAARLLDVAARCAHRTRGRIYLALASRGVDVRGPLFGDATLDDEARVAALARLRAHRGATEPLVWSAPLALVMARACADWSRFASHPRVLFFHYARHVGAAQWHEALTDMQRWPLSVEVHAELTRQRERTPSRVLARSIDKGAWACGRCDSRDVRAVRRWSDADGDAADASSAATTGEIEFHCARCALKYWASWDEETLSTEDPVPEAWVVA